MQTIDKVKKELNLNISEKLLIALVFEMTRKKDKEFVKELQRIQKENNIVFNTFMRNRIRKYYYFKEELSDISEFQIYNINTFTYTDKELEDVFEDFYRRLHTYDPEKIINSLKTKIHDLEIGNKIDRHADKWFDYYYKKYSNIDYSLIIYKVDQKEFEKNNYNIDFVNNFIFNTYNKLINYRHLAIVFESEIIDRDQKDLTWSIIYKAGIYAENFKEFKDKFIPFKQQEQIRHLTNFLSSRKIGNPEELSTEFYKSMSYGYKFEDLYISDNGDSKILILRKIELDNSNVPCPSCFTINQRGNSYPEVFLRSWECTNPSCPDRSKSGRGKRFDEYGTYRYFKLIKNNKEDHINERLYFSWRRDIFEHTSDWKEYLINNYSYKGETVFAKNTEIIKTLGRNIVCDYEIDANLNPIKFNELPIYKLFKSIFDNKREFKDRLKILKNDIEVINDNSTSYLNSLVPNQIGAAITSPPYYNAREYSQWENVILYLVDMLLNADAVYNSLADDSYYLYNIGDIVSEDNIYVVSLMSNKRIQLGFLSCMIFEIVGFNLSGNIIWDKGQVQSKRNSTINLFSGYVKCINSYEHVFVFKKGHITEGFNKVIKINPVIKINSKGENTYKHTAPYPLDLVNLIKSFAQKDLYILDPYLGSGTTLKWALKNGYKGLGIEMNEDYYKLSLDRIFENNN